MHGAASWRKLREFLTSRNITTILLDEKSMLGQQQLGWIQLCLPATGILRSNDVAP